MATHLYVYVNRSETIRIDGESGTTVTNGLVGERAFTRKFGKCLTYLVIGGAGDRTRTYYPIITNDVLYLMSYTGIVFIPRAYYRPTNCCAVSLLYLRRTSITDGPVNGETVALPAELLDPYRSFV